MRQDTRISPNPPCKKKSLKSWLGTAFIRAAESVAAPSQSHLLSTSSASFNVTLSPDKPPLSASSSSSLSATAAWSCARAAAASGPLVASTTNSTSCALAAAAHARRIPSASMGSKVATEPSVCEICTTRKPAVSRASTGTPPRSKRTCKSSRASKE